MSVARPQPPSEVDVRLETEANQYLQLLLREGIYSREAFERRAAEVQDDIRSRGWYWHSPRELEHGAKVAWRNSSRCIGRLYWQKLEVRDLRHLGSAEAIFEALVEHLRLATNGGKIQSMISIFAPQEPGQEGIRIWNPQLIRYAGYRQENGKVLGDPALVEFTELARSLGWQGGEGTPFDLLPLIIQVPGQEPRLFELPADAVLEVPLSHPDYPEFADLGLKWHALPVISNMRLEIGGVSYSAAPFNGWYMGTEIGARNLGDEDRYDMLPQVAKLLGLNTRSNRTLWKDRALVELNVAVLHSFQQFGVTVIDHHTASKHFQRFESYEEQADRPVCGDWSWLVPPISGSASPLFHREYHDTLQKPNYFLQPDPWKASRPARRFEVPLDVEQAERDALTGLPHRAALDARLERFAEDGGAVLLMDLDDFAEVNAEYGQLAANSALRQVGRALLGVIRPDDDCARFGGDEFCVLLRGADSQITATRVAERIREALGEVYVDSAPDLHLSASFGIAMVPPGHDAVGALQRARNALWTAKEAGRGRVVAEPVDSSS